MVELIIVAIVAVLAGLAIGWLIASRPAAALASELAVANTLVADAELVRQTRDAVERERNEAQQALSAARAEAAVREDALVKAGEQVAVVTARLERIEAERGELASDLAGLRSQSTERDKAHETALAALQTHFEATAGKVVEAAQAKFLDRAEQRFSESEKLQGEKLSQLLMPVHERLKTYEEIVTKVEADRKDAFSLLTGQIETMRVDALRVATGADNIVSALRHAPKARGNWGEQQLRNVLESCGVSEHTDFDVEVSVTVDGARLRPDAVVRVPGGRSLIIDAKVSFNAFQDAISAVDETERLSAFKRHASSMRAHVDGLNIKDYSRAFEDTPDYVVMFVGGEHFLSAALEHDPRLWDDAWGKRVLIATPTNLVAIARTVSAVWRQEKLAKQAREIALLGKQMYDRLALVGERFGKAGTALNKAVDFYNEATKTFNGDLAVTGRRFKELNIEVGTRELVEVEQADKLVTHIFAETGVEPIPALPDGRTNVV